MSDGAKPGFPAMSIEQAHALLTAPGTPLEVGEVVGHVVQGTRDAQDRLAGAPEVLLHLGALAQAELADVEHHHRLVPDLQGVVVRLEEVLGRDARAHRGVDGRSRYCAR